MSAPMPAERRDAIIAHALTRHSAGESLRQIAPGLGISHVRLRAILLGDVPEQYRAAQADSYLERIAQADEMLEQAIVRDADGNLDQASSTVNIAQAREIGRFARWDAERRLPHLFGARVVGAGAGVTVNIVLDALQQARQALARPAIDVTPEPDNDATSMP